MVIFGISGLSATALAWLFPWLNLNKTEATLAGLIGIGFFIFQGIRLKRSNHNEAEQFSGEVRAEENT